MNINEKIYQHKQEWLERIMASDLTPAQKVFAFSIYKRAYGTKIQSFPDTEKLQADTGLARSKFSEYRQALFACGALSGTKDRQARGRQENYTYTLNLSWDGQVPSRNVKSLVGTSPDVQVPSGDTQVPSGGSNTTSNTTKRKTTSKTTTIAPAKTAVAIDSSSNSEVRYEGYLNLKDFEDFTLTLETLALPSNFKGVPANLTSRDTAITQVPRRDLKDEDYDTRSQVLISQIGTGRREATVEDEDW